METHVLAALFIVQVIQCVHTEWSPWSPPSPCSHTCGLGVHYQTRSCLQEKHCLGANRRYSTCNIKPCAKGSVSIRETLCKQFNNISLGHDRHDWMPHHDSGNACSLSCKDRRSGEVYSLQSQVEDGTPCGELVSGLCINGFCEKLGCDGNLGGNELDKCGKCGGDGNSCYTISRSYSLVNHFTGYNDIFEIPVAATNIMIVERHPGKHYLALRNQKGKYYLNGDWKIVKSTDIELAGTTFHYHHPINSSDEAETLTADGPTNERLMLTLLYKDPDPDVKVEYKYSLPLDAELVPMKDTPSKTSPSYLEVKVDDASGNDIIKPQVNQYTWISGPWKDCSEKCAGGHQTRHVKCLQRGENKVVNRDWCKGVSKPPHRQKCNIQPCHKSCTTSTFGCCPDGKTPARGENHVGCSQPLTDQQSKTCQGSKHGCCEDGIRRALGPNKEGCPRIAGHKSCAVSEFGCCSDGVTRARGKNQEGCPYDTDLCLEPRKKGKCRARLVRYYFDQNLKACKKFLYGGCRGNGNRFETKLECEMNCRSLLKHEFSQSVTGKDVCNLPHDLRQCKEQVIKWYYDKVKNLCSRYWFGGCSEGGNHFDTEEDCLQTCQYHSASKPRTTAISALALCNLPSDPGPCTQGAKRWYFDVIRGECLAFAYGGCQGNANKFETKTECERMCSMRTVAGSLERGGTSRSGSYPGQCMRQRDERLCTEWSSRWYFDSEQKTCEDFWFGGCSEDNANVFSSEQECQNTCLNKGAVRERPTKQVSTRCSQPPDQRSCGQQRNSWFYNNEKHSCERFVWGGCSHGMETNRFDSEEECRRSCNRSRRGERRRRKNRRKKKTDRVPSGQADKCSGTPDTRICGTPRPKWFYNTDKGYCEQMWDGGCDKNSVNLFNTKDDCRRECQGYRTRSRIPVTGSLENRDHRKDSCGVAPDKRICKSAVRRWFYDLESGRCHEYVYGFCTEGGNMFTSQLDCEGKCGGFLNGLPPEEHTPVIPPSARKVTRYTPPVQEVRETRPVKSQIRRTNPLSHVSDVCFEKKLDRYCGVWTRMWFYNHEIGTCQNFWHGGCGTGGNQFVSEEECRKKCVIARGSLPSPLRPIPRPTPIRPAPTARRSNDARRCVQAADTQLCGEYVERWRYNEGNGRCETFWHGGCPSKGNVFDSERSCRRECEGRLDSHTTPARVRTLPDPSHKLRLRPDTREDVCEQRKDTRYCGKWTRKWFYNTEDRKCEAFYAGGCSEGGNQFDSENDCRRKCEVRTNVDRYRTTRPPYRSPPTEGNRYVTQSPVRRRTHSPGSNLPERCLMERDENICGEWENMWYYDSFKRKCKPFWFASCGMSGNKFATEADCRQTCLSSRHPALSDGKQEHYRLHERCLEEKDTRLCRSWRTRWFYDQGTGRCQDFLHGGCTEGGNQFLSRQECHERCPSHITPYRPSVTVRPRRPDVTPYRPRVTPRRPVDPRHVNPGHSQNDRCMLEKNSKYCGEWRTRWFFNRYTRRCEHFLHGSCSSDGNVFTSEQDCHFQCRRWLRGEGQPADVRYSSQRLHERCLMAKNSDYCRPWERRWYYDQSSQSCEQFMDGGCDRYGNVFTSQEECDRSCPGIRRPERTPAPIQPYRPTRIRNDDRCLSERNTRFCGRWKKRWYFNEQFRRCEEFQYGGCDSDGNQFLSRYECQRTCLMQYPNPVIRKNWSNYGDICYQDKDVRICGHCRTKWYYNSDKERCERFLHCGCSNSDNKFDSFEECDNRCSGSLQPPALTTYRPRSWYTTALPRLPDPKPDICNLPKKEGRCYGTFSQWYYDAQYGSCLEFNYGGCDGNANNFDTEAECILTCDRSALQRRPLPTRAPVTRSPIKSANICDDPVDSRLCGEWQNRWKYNSETGRCEQFWHGGCSEQGNVFKDETECRRACQGRRQTRPDDRDNRSNVVSEYCLQPRDDRRCGPESARWYYEAFSGQCYQFRYHGCTPGGNQFSSEEACRRACVGRYTPRPQIQPTRLIPRRPLPPRATEGPQIQPRWRPDKQDVCGMDADPGDCKQFVKRWYYHYTEDGCFTFDYGGCGGNANNFNSEYECSNTCLGGRRVQPLATPRWDRRATQRPARPDTDKCDDPVDSRLCGEWQNRWKYNSETGRCEQFWHGGCSEQGNVFKDETECRRACQGRRQTRPDDRDNRSNVVSDVCLYPADKGPCRQNVLKWHFDKRTRRCITFNYGGCGGNHNLFDNSQECMRTCHHLLRQGDRRRVQGDDPDNGEVCLMDQDETLCTEWEHRWLYNRTAGQCQRFWYGGCDTIGNHFDSQESCWTKCYEYASNPSPEREIEPEPEISEREEVHPEPEAQPESTDQREPAVAHTDVKIRDICTLRKDERECKEKEVKWYFSSSEGKCDRFWYGGCNDDGNMFDSQADCNKMCQHHQSGFSRHGTEDNRPHTDGSKHNPDKSRQTPDERENHPDEVNRISPPATDDVCSLSPDAGPCRDNVVTQWFYDPVKKRCDRFRYGGCEGNGNRFETEEACQGTCSERTRVPTLDTKHPDDRKVTQVSVDNTDTDICQLPFDIGPCLASFSRWYYDTDVSKCKKFIYGGCKGNANNFQDKKACRRRCDPSKIRHPKQEEIRHPKQEKETKRQEKISVNNTIQTDPNVCRMPKDDRFCGDWVLKWVYNQTSQSCNHVWLGNCGQGGNQFDTIENCQNLCVNSIPVQPDIRPDPNTVPRERVPNGVGGSIDRDTPTPEKNVCFLKSDAGPCRDNIITLWFYDSANKRCDRFRYGGCEGNRNRFETEEECRRACSERKHHNRVDTSVPVSNLCSLSPDAGPCRDNVVTQWFYDSAKQRCDRFRYGGCEGNGNRFETQEQCQKACSERTPRVDPGVTGGPNTRVTFGSRPPTNQGSEECNASKFGCCPDGLTPARDENYNTCPSLASEILPLGTNSLMARSGDDITIACNVLGAPKPTIVWYQDGVRIPTDSPMFTVDSDGTLTVTALKSSDTGEYTCTADNGVGFPASQRVNLVVQESPVIMVTPSNVITAPGGTARLHCSASGSPPPNLSWLDNQGRPLRASSRVSVFPNGTFIITDAQPQDAGTYTCIARSGVSDPARKQVNLSIKEGVIAKIKAHENMYVEGDVLNLRCQVSGYPYPSVTWLKDDVPVNTSNKVRLHHRGEKLSVHHLTIEDAGLYQCKVNNGQAEALASTLVRVDLRDLSDGECTDPKGKVYCRIIVAASMCHRRHFAKLCCESCQDWLKSPS